MPLNGIFEDGSTSLDRLTLHTSLLDEIRGEIRKLCHPILLGFGRSQPGINDNQSTENASEEYR
jgi:hypothetical protein